MARINPLVLFNAAFHNSLYVKVLPNIMPCTLKEFVIAGHFELAFNTRTNTCSSRSQVRLLVQIAELLNYKIYAVSPDYALRSRAEYIRVCRNYPIYIASWYPQNATVEVLTD